MTLDEAIDNYYKIIYSYVYGSSGKNETFTEECCNDIFFLYWLKAENKIDDRAVFAWLLKTADYKLNNYIRKKKRERMTLPVEAVDEFNGNQAELVDLIISDEDILAAKEKLLSLLSGEERQMYEDYFVHKMSYEQIAAKLGINRATASKRLKHITKKLTDEANKIFGITGAAVILQTLSALLGE